MREIAGQTDAESTLSRGRLRCCQNTEDDEGPSTVPDSRSEA